MTNENHIGADYRLLPDELAENLEFSVSVKQPAMVWGPPGVGKSQIARQVAEATNRIYIDIRALLLDPVDLRGLPYRDEKITRWAPPAFLPNGKSKGKFLINFDELPAAPQMVQTALYQLVLERRLGEYELPEGACVMACGNREIDGGVVGRMLPALASRFVHFDVRVSGQQWCDWGARNDIAPEVLFFIQLRDELLFQFDHESAEKAFPCPRTWEMTSNALKLKNGLSADCELAFYRGLVGAGAAVEFVSFLQIWRELPHPKAIISDPDGADIPENASTLIALCGSLFRLANEENFQAIVDFSKRLRPELAEFLVSSCVKRDKNLQSTNAFIAYAAMRSST